LICYGRFQSFELFHHFKRFVTCIYVVTSSCPVVTHFNLIVSEDRWSRTENFQRRYSFKSAKSAFDFELYFITAT